VRHGVRLGIDVGTVRVGVARSDLHGMLATPVETVARGSGDLARIVAIAVELEVSEVIVGHPLALSGRETASTADAVAFARLGAAALPAAGLPVDVRLVDERLSTVSAQAAVRTSRKSSKQTRSVIDQVAAVIILQHALDVERSSERPPGVVVDPDERRPS
jgi:putative Holliday junction resolvase